MHSIEKKSKGCYFVFYRGECFSSCEFSVNLYLEAIVDSMEQKIQGVEKDAYLKPRIEG